MLHYQLASATRQLELPRLKVSPYGKKSKIMETRGTDEDVAPFVCARSISTYPMLPTMKRDGDPIADKLYCAVSKNRVIVTIADGCNWGARPEQAAIRATNAVKDYLQIRHQEIQDLQDVGHYLYRAFCCAHNKIIEGKEDIWDAGTTTLLSGMCVELDTQNESDPKWAFCCASVGDCKAFLYTKKTNEVVDLTAGNRVNQKDPRDPGGRLGPYIGNGDPDLRNMKLYPLLFSYLSYSSVTV